MSFFGGTGSAETPAQFPGRRAQITWNRFRDYVRSATRAALSPRPYRDLPRAVVRVRHRSERNDAVRPDGSGQQFLWLSPGGGSRSLGTDANSSSTRSMSSGDITRIPHMRSRDLSDQRRLGVDDRDLSPASATIDQRRTVRTRSKRSSSRSPDDPLARRFGVWAFPARRVVARTLRSQMEC